MAVSSSAVALVLAVLVCTVAVDAAKFTVCNTGVTNADLDQNWTPQAPFGADYAPSSVTLGLDAFDVEMRTAATAGDLSAGSTLFLANNMNLVLPTDNFKIVFNESNTDEPAKYSYDPTAVDISCHTNLCEYDAANPSVPGPVATQPLCQNDILQLEGDRSFYVAANSNNIEFLTFVQVRYHDQPISTCDELVALSPREFHLDCNKIFFNNLQKCEENFWVDDNDECFCHTTCPASEEQAREQENDWRESGKKKAEAQQELANEQTTTTYKFTMDMNDLDAASQNALKAYFYPTENKEVLIDSIEARLKDHWNTQTVTVGADLTETGLILTIQGDVTASAGSLFGTDLADQAEVDALASAGIVVDATAFGPGDTSVIIDQLLTAAGTSITAMIELQAEQALDAAVPTCAACPDPEDTKDIVKNIGDVVDDANQVNGGDLAACKGQDVQCVKDVLESAGTTDASNEDVEKAAQDILDTLNQTPDDQLDELATFVDETKDDIQDSNDKKDTAADSVPADRELTMTVHYFEQGSDTWLLYSNTESFDTLKQNSLANLRGVLRLADSNPLSIGIVTAPETSRRRRDDGYPYLEANVTYVKPCFPTQPDDDCAFGEGSDTRTDVATILEQTARTVPLAGPDCYDLVLGWNATCLQQIADDAFKAAKETGSTDAQAEKTAREAVLDVRQCNPIMGRDPATGECQMVDPAANSQAGSLASSARGALGSESSSDSSAGIPIPIVAGAVAGVILLAAVGYVVYKRQAPTAPRATKASAAAERDVVAFENPMYDVDKTIENNPLYDPASEQGTGLYDELGGVNEGLYDEPDSFGFNDVDVAGEDYGDGYLDTAPADDDGGYLDTDDAGYLDTAPYDAGVVKENPLYDGDFDDGGEFDNPEFEDEEGGYLDFDGKEIEDE
eukprot:m.189734 g.189734  ORF g.189734 m.189734 type:complete len:909 (-) comp18214_c3_seq1:68-2794(-)